MIRGVIALLFMGLSSTAVAETKPLVPMDFAEGFELAGGEGSIRYLLLKNEIYRGMVAVDGSDIAVFNAEGRQLPHVIEGEEQKVARKRTRSLKFFPVLGETEDASVAFWQLDAGADSFEVRHRAWIEKREKSQQEAGSYILKNTAGKESITKLGIDWQQSRTSMIAAVRLESSDDMINWKTVISRSVLSRISHQGEILSKTTIHFPPVRAKFLRLSWLSGNPGVTVTAIHADYSARMQPNGGSWTTLAPVVAEEQESNSFLFDTGGPMPVRKLAFEMPVDGLYYRGMLYSRSDEEQQWRYRTRFNQYRLQKQGLTTESDPVEIPDVRDRYWKIILEQPLGLPPREIPRIRVMTQPQRVVFLAQGEGPYLFAYGSRITDKPFFRLPAYKLPDDFSEKTAARVSLAEKRVLGGEESRMERKPPPDVKTWLLWLVLLLGVVVMGWMAKGLLREMDSKGSE